MLFRFFFFFFFQPKNHVTWLQMHVKLCLRVTVSVGNSQYKFLEGLQHFMQHIVLRTNLVR